MAPRLRVNNPLLLVAVFLLMIGLVLGWNAYMSDKAFREHHLGIAGQSVNGAANEITLMIRGLRTSLELLMHGHQDLLRRLAQDPENTEAHARLARVLGNYFPEYYAFTIAGTDGRLIYDDFGERIGKLCRADLRRFAAGKHPAGVYIHPGPSEYHFDVMLPWNHNPARPGVFFVSFKPDLVARLLRNSESPGHRLLLVRRDTADLIEITAAGSRDKMQRPLRLSPEEQKRILYSMPVEETQWQLVDLPDASLFAGYRGRIVNQIILVTALFLLVSVFMLWRIRREERRRATAEQALQESHNRLEERVEERTQELVSVNKSLQHEIDERVRAEARMRKLSRVVEQTDDTVLITNRDGFTEYVNPAFENKTGYHAKEAIGRKPNLIKSGLHDKKFYKKLWGTILAGKVFRGMFINRRKDGSLYYEEKTITPLKDDQGRVTHFVATGKDITERMEAQERLNHLAHHDALTDLPNRALLVDRLGHALAQAQRNERLVAVLFLDLDRFKTINDSLGHGIGDNLLKTVADRLRQCIRDSDSIARLGGDEFTIVLEGIKDVREVVVIAEKVLETIAQPFNVNGHELLTTASIGITLFPFDNDDIETLLQNADTAMYRAKKAGGNTYAFFTADMSKDAVQRLAMEGRLRHALERQEFTLHYQPRVDVRACRVTGAEALLRWWDPEKGDLVSPAEFIPLLEETGLIIPVGEWVLRTACRDFQAMAEAGGPSLRVSVNLSPRQFQQKDLVATVTRILEETGLDPKRLELEITESLLVDNVEAVAGTLRALHELGVHIAVDDFGTGYSSLSYLKRFPIDCLKVDRAFVRDVTDDPDDAEIVKAIIAMAHSLRMDVVAEGVETRDQLRFLRKLSCEEIQGYLFSRPLPLDELKAWLRTAGNRITKNGCPSGVRRKTA